MDDSCSVYRYLPIYGRGGEPNGSPPHCLGYFVPSSGVLEGGFFGLGDGLAGLDLAAEERVDAAQHVHGARIVELAEFVWGEQFAPGASAAVGLSLIHI